jgi:transposase
MAEVSPVAGIDCSAERLDVHIYPLEQAFSVANDELGWRELRRRLDQAQVRVVGLEATGGLERGVTRYLVGKGCEVRVLNPARVRQFAKAAGRLAKNDSIDAQMIARFLVAVPTRPWVCDPQREKLAQLVAARAQLLDHLTAEQNQARWHDDPVLRRIDKRRQSSLQADIQTLDRRIAELIAADPQMAAKFDILRSMKGVGPILAATLMAFLPELGQLSRKQIAALAGVAPFDDQSGKRQGVRYIQGGRPVVRAPLYMAALTAARYNPVLNAFHQKLRQAGKKPKVAIVAVMRRMLTILNALLRDRVLWENRLA